MNWLDILILVVTGVAALVGWRIGIIRVVISMVGIAVGIVLAGQFFSDAAPLFEDVLDSSNGANIAGFILIFVVVVLIATAIVGSVIRKVAGILMLGLVDKGVGLLFGVLVAFSIFSAILSVIEANPVLSLEETIGDSTLGSFLVDDFDILLRGPSILPEDLNSAFPDFMKDGGNPLE